MLMALAGQVSPGKQNQRKEPNKSKPATVTDSVQEEKMISEETTEEYWVFTDGIWKGLQLVGAEVKVSETCAALDLPWQRFQLVLGGVQKHQLLQGTDSL